MVLTVHTHKFHAMQKEDFLSKVTQPNVHHQPLLQLGITKIILNGFSSSSIFVHEVVLKNLQRKTLAQFLQQKINCKKNCVPVPKNKTNKLRTYQHICNLCNKIIKLFIIFLLSSCWHAYIVFIVHKSLLKLRLCTSEFFIHLLTGNPQHRSRQLVPQVLRAATLTYTRTNVILLNLPIALHTVYKFC